MDPVLPGEDLIEEGVNDLRAQRETAAALLVAIGSPRLRRLGIELPIFCLRILSTSFMSYWLKTSVIPRIRVTML